MFLAFIPQLAGAANTPAAVGPTLIQADFKTLKNTGAGRVDAVIDAQTVLLKDGKIVRLLGIGYPLSTGEEPDATLIAAKERLAQLLPEGTEVQLYQKRQVADAKRGRMNRMGHLLAHLARKQTGEWVNGTLVADGLAWVSTDPTNPEMADQLYTLEQKARAAGKGLWSADSAHGVLTPLTAQQGEGQFRIVEGRVDRAATSKNNLYLNFGTDWHNDFTVMLSADLRRQLSRRGIDPMALAGQTVRVRGWLRSWNGPFLELETPERLEIVTEPRPSTELPPESSTDAVEKPAVSSETGQLNP